MFEDQCVWSALYPISNHSHIRQLQFATHTFSQQVLQQAVQISTCQWLDAILPMLRESGTCSFCYHRNSRGGGADTGRTASSVNEPRFAIRYEKQSDTKNNPA